MAYPPDSVLVVLQQLRDIQAASSGTGEDITLLTNASATGSAVTVTSGNYNFVADGTWNGATAQLQYRRTSGSNWIDITPAVLTADGAVTRTPISDGEVRVAISGASSPAPTISSILGRVP